MGRPRATANTVVSSATLRLARAASIHSALEKNCSYHLSVQPGGGNTSHCDDPNDSSTMNTIGNNRNSPISPVVAYRPRRIRRLMALGVRSMTAYLALLAPTGDSGWSFR
ncbi:hypothetical protein D9M72_653380 [compost metagenome]